MAKRSKKPAVARLVSEERPTATNVDWPVFVPNEAGEVKIEIGRARMRYGTLVVEFKDTAGAVAIQNMIARGVLMGFGMIMIKPDVVNEMYQEVVADEAATAVAKDKALAAGLLVMNLETGEVAPKNPDQTIDEIVAAFKESESRSDDDVEDVVIYDIADDADYIE